MAINYEQLIKTAQQIQAARLATVPFPLDGTVSDQHEYLLKYEILPSLENGCQVFDKEGHRAQLDKGHSGHGQTDVTFQLLGAKMNRGAHSNIAVRLQLQKTKALAFVAGERPGSEELVLEVQLRSWEDAFKKGLDRALELYFSTSR